MTMVDDSVLLISSAYVGTGKTTLSGKIEPDENVPIPEEIKLSDLHIGWNDTFGSFYACTGTIKDMKEI